MAIISAWKDIQLDWATKTNDKNVTGVLLWDLSAAFDTLDVDILNKNIMATGHG